MTRPPYDRDALIEVLIYHQRVDAQHCACGWGQLGASFANHQIEVYEASVREHAS